MPTTLRALAVLLLVIGIAGCVAGTAETTVAEDGSLENAELEVVVDPLVYSILEEEAVDAGYEDVEDRMTSEATRVWDEVDYEEERTEDGVRIRQTMVDGDPSATNDLDVVVEEDEIVFVDHKGPGIDREEIAEAYVDAIELVWIVHMPGEITDTNGEIRSDQESVEWTFEKHGDLDRFVAVSERPEHPGERSLDDHLPVVIIFGTVGAFVLALTMREYHR